MYGGAWTGPPSAIFSQNNQTNALSALVSAITIPPFDSTGGSTSTVSGAPPSVSVSPVSTTMKSESRGSRVAAIVGSVLGALVLMAIVFGIWFRRRRQQMRSLPLRESGAVTTVEPYSSAPTSHFFLDSAPLTIPRHARASGKSNQTPVQGDARSAQLSTPVGAPLATVNPTIEAGLASTRAPTVTLPTVELVRLLNERLRDTHWDEETPPEYPLEAEP
ncbi:hypothetical protein B0H10DRAFT_129865 [Mycena sp. CBHHK59/15]|nr:hypothetical protein B0H10DRAFT_129865 [Mycena sp. CBHHK59/15]